MKPLPFLLPLLGAASLPAATLYTENFESISNTGGASIGNVNWDGYTGTSTAGSLANDTSSPPTITADIIGTLGPHGGSSAYMYFQKQASADSATDFFAFTSTTINAANFEAFAPSAYTDLSLTWNQNHTGFSSGAVYATVQVGADWYVSTVDQRGSGSSGGRSLDILTATWTNLLLDTTPMTGSLAIGATPFNYADLFSSNQTITGVGFYVTGLAAPASTGANTFRLDDIAFVPEPSSFLLTFSGLGFLLCRRKRA